MQVPGNIFKGVRILEKKKKRKRRDLSRAAKETFTRKLIIYPGAGEFARK